MTDLLITELCDVMDDDYWDYLWSAHRRRQNNEDVQYTLTEYLNRLYESRAVSTWGR